MTLRRLIDLPGLAELERKALMNPRFGEAEARDAEPEIDAWSRETFGLTYDEAFDARPEGWDRIDRKPWSEQARAFEDAGWDVTDDKRRPLRMLEHFALPMWIAIRGVAGSVPFAPVVEVKDEWGASMQAQAAKFRKDRR